MTKKLLYISMVLAFGSCASDSIVETSSSDQSGQKSAICFAVSQSNSTRATFLQDIGHYNFGVFGYKSSDPTRTKAGDCSEAEKSMS